MGRMHKGSSRSRETRCSRRRADLLLPGFLALWLVPGLSGCGGGAGISTADRLSGNIPRPEKVTDARGDLGQAEFPNLGSVPELPPAVTSLRERSRILASLESDRLSAGQEAPQGADAAPPEAAHVADIYFPDGSSDLDEQDQAVLRAVAELQSRRGGRLRVVGHSSAGPAGDAAPELERNLSNFQISLARANSVAEALVRLGVTRDRLLVEARSDSQPAYRETSEAGSAANRRVEIFQVFDGAGS